MPRAKKRDISDALTRHLEERERIWKHFRPSLKPDEYTYVLDAKEELTLRKGGMIDLNGREKIKVQKRRGRPGAHMSQSPETFQSLEAATFMVEELQIWREKQGAPRVWNEVRKKLWEKAHEFYPKAELHLVEDHIRLNRKWFYDDEIDEAAD
jgi:hypothetical protein